MATLTLVGGHQQSALDLETISAVRRAIDAVGGASGPPFWLEPGRACDLDIDEVDPELAQSAALEAVPGRFDAFGLTDAPRRKKLFLADMDSTIIAEETLDELAGRCGLKDKIAAITERAMRGDLDFETALIERVAMLENLPEAELAATAAAMTVSDGARTLIATLAQAGIRCVLVSGGFGYFTKQVAQNLGFHADYSNTLEITHDKLTGKVLPPIRDKDDKLTTLMKEAAALHITMEDTMTVGDGANDLPMLMAAGLGVAYRAKPAVKSRARYHIEHSDLTALLFIQGFHRDEFVL